MTAFDRAWRRSREDSMIDSLQQAYDKVDDYENVQHFIHVADPIEVFMPYSDKPEKLFRDHLEPTKLVNDEGKYLDSEESWRNMQDDIANLARPRKDRKKSKYARIFVPNPESKRDKIGDFHLDESKSEEWQEKLASEQMTAFDRAWDLVKGGEPMVEFGGNDICPECGTKRTQRTNQLGHDYPVVHGWACPKCESFTPHDVDFAHSLELDQLCEKCYGSGEQDEINRKRDSFECDECNGTGWKE